MSTITFVIKWLTGVSGRYGGDYWRTTIVKNLGREIGQGFNEHLAPRSGVHQIGDAIAGQGLGRPG